MHKQNHVMPGAAPSVALTSNSGQEESRGPRTPLPNPSPSLAGRRRLTGGQPGPGGTTFADTTDFLKYLSARRGVDRAEALVLLADYVRDIMRSR